MSDGRAKAKLPPFINKLGQMLTRKDLGAAISWTGDGKGVLIGDTDLLSLSLPSYFKHNKPCSFIRQLNIYGFRKQPGPDLVFINEKFTRSAPDRWVEVKRRKSTKRGGDKEEAPNDDIVHWIGASKRAKADKPVADDAFALERGLLWGEIHRLQAKEVEREAKATRLVGLIDSLLVAGPAESQAIMDEMSRLRGADDPRSFMVPPESLGLPSHDLLGGASIGDTFDVEQWPTLAELEIDLIQEVEVDLIPDVQGLRLTDSALTP